MCFNLLSYDLGYLGSTIYELSWVHVEQTCGGTNDNRDGKVVDGVKFGVAPLHPRGSEGIT